MIFVVQTCPPRDCRALVARLRVQSHLWRSSPPSVVVVPDVGNEGQLRGQLRALALVKGHGAVTLLEDDIEICDGFVPYVCERWSYRPEPVIRWYAPGDLPAGLARGWHALPGGEFKCNQAVTLREDFVMRLLSSEPTARRLAAPERHSGDALIADVLAALGEPFAQHSPGLVQHTGRTSLVTASRNTLRDRFHEAGYHLSHNYIGRDGDPRRPVR